MIKDQLFTTFYRSTYIWNGLSLVFARMNTSASLTLFLRNTIINNLQINRHMPKAMYLSKLNKKYHFFVTYESIWMGNWIEYWTNRKNSFPISIIIIFLSSTFRQLVRICAHTIHPKNKQNWMIGIKIERDHFESILVLSFARTSKLNMFCIICYLQENTLPIYDWIVDLSTCRSI